MIQHVHTSKYHTDMAMGVAWLGSATIASTEHGWDSSQKGGESLLLAALRQRNEFEQSG